MDNFNNILLKYILNTELYDISYYSSISRMSRIILNSRVPNFRDKIKNRFGITNSYKLAYEFFYSLDPAYASYFVERANSSDIILNYFKKNNQTAFSYLDDAGNKKIYLPYGRDICDCFTLVHEVLHDMNLDSNNISITRSLFTEYISIYGEMLLSDFISKKYGVDFSINSKFTFNGCYIKAISVDFQLSLLKKMLDKGYVNDYDVANIINQYNPFYRSYLLKNYKTIFDNSDLSIEFESRYVIAVLLSCYTKDLVKNKRYNTDMYKFLNENINYLYPEEFYSMLDLDVVDEYTLDLSEDSYKKLKKSYCKYMR